MGDVGLFYEQCRALLAYLRRARELKNGIILLIAQHKAQLNLSGCEDCSAFALLSEHAANPGIAEEVDWRVVARRRQGTHKQGRGERRRCWHAAS
jgi:hypothetical protein